MKVPNARRSILRLILRIVGVVLVLLSNLGISWLLPLGLVLFGISFFFLAAPTAGGFPTAQQLIAYAAFLGIGIVLILTGISWLTFLGVAVALSAAFFSSQWPATSRTYIPLCIYLGGAVLELVWSVRDGDILARNPPPVVYAMILVGVWVWGVAAEVRCWHKARRAGSEL